MGKCFDFSLLCDIGALLMTLSLLLMCSNLPRWIKMVKKKKKGILCFLRFEHTSFCCLYSLPGETLMLLDLRRSHKSRWTGIHHDARCVNWKERSRWVEGKVLWEAQPWEAHPGGPHWASTCVCCKCQQQGTQGPTVWIDLHKPGFLIYFSVPLPIFSKLLPEERSRHYILD